MDDGIVSSCARPPAGPGPLVRLRRQRAGLTQAQLAAVSGVSIGVIRDLEQGVTSRPRPLTLRRLETALGARLAGGGQSLGGQSPGGQAGGRPGRQPPAADPHAPAGHLGWAGTGLFLQALGPLCAWLGAVPLGLGSFRQQAVTGLLAVYAGAVVSRDALSEMLWGDDPPPSAAVMIQACISRIRRVLEPGRQPGAAGGILETAGSGYRLRAGDGRLRLDVAQFDELSGRGGAALRAGQAAAACQLFEEALGLWQGEPLAGLAVLQAHPGVAGLAHRRAAVVTQYAAAASGLGWHDLVLPHLRALTERDALNERAHAGLMIALAGTGQQAAALTVYERLTRRLDDQLGLRPSAELAAAHARVLRQDIPAAAHPPATSQLLVPEAPPAQPAVVPGWPPAQPAVPPGQLPPAVSGFTGREAQAAALTAILRGGACGSAATAAGLPVAVIGGLPGTGKTALALQTAHQARASFPDGQLWAYLRGPGLSPRDPGEVLGEFLRALGVPPGALPAAVGERSALYRSILADRRVLVVADDAASAAQVRPLLPGTTGSAMLVTSSSALALPGGGRLLPLGPLRRCEALDMLGLVAGRERVAAEPAAAGEIISACCSLPLAIEIAGRRLAARPGWPLATMARRIAKFQLGELTAGELSVRGSMARSYRALSRPARRALRLLAGSEADLLPEQQVAAVAGAPGVVDELIDAFLLSPTAADPAREPCYRLYSLVRSFAREDPEGACPAGGPAPHAPPARPLAAVAGYLPG